MHITGIIYTFIQMLLFNQPNILLYNISKYSLGKFGYHLLMLTPIILFTKFIKNNYIYKKNND